MTYVFGRMNDQAAALDYGIRQEAYSTGTYVLHTPAARCSCVRDGGQPSASCRICNGDGFFYAPGTETVQHAIVSQVSTQREFVSGPGIYEREDLLVTFAKRVFVTVKDRIRLARPDLFHFTVPAEGFVLERGTGQFDELPNRVARLLFVSKTDDRMGTVTYYRPGIDVTATENKLYWGNKAVPPVSGAVAPPSGLQYAVMYHGDYDWVVVENLAPRASGSVSLGTRAVCRRLQTDVRNQERAAPIGPLGFNPQLFS